MTFGVLTATIMKDADFWGVTPCILVFTNISEEQNIFVSRVCPDFVQAISIIIIMHHPVVKLCKFHASRHEGV
jgi:hypothetical protein